MGVIGLVAVGATSLLDPLVRAQVADIVFTAFLRVRADRHLEDYNLDMNLLTIAWDGHTSPFAQTPLQFFFGLKPSWKTQDIV